MTMLVFLLEEPSAREMLQAIMPRLLPDTDFLCIVFKGKQDLEKQLSPKLRGWLVPDSRFIVLRDQDSGDCMKIKVHLQNLCEQAGRNDALIRIACRELESFYLGDLTAVEKGLGLTGLAPLQNKAKFRDPDHLENPSMELIALTNKYYQKVSGSRAIAPHLDLVANRSVSFNNLISGIRSLQP
ncbi:MAG: DUF4276 family protein [Magnetococcales bacterium]|nr:DUF4276 family protein [Magnetococcales bacterium]